MGCYIVEEADGTSRFELEDGSGFVVLEDCIPTPPGGDMPAGGDARRGRRRLDVNSESEWLSVVMGEV